MRCSRCRRKKAGACALCGNCLVLLRDGTARALSALFTASRERGLKKEDMDRLVLRLWTVFRRTHNRDAGAE